MKSNAKPFLCLWMGLILVVSGCKSTPQQKLLTPTSAETRNIPQPGNTASPQASNIQVSAAEDQNQALLPVAQADLASFPNLTHYTNDVSGDYP